ncbi:MAG: aldo/keto reductase [Dehalococcoidia bacterium]|nr:aldo/keto reductase [Dehalococcoidia bacterium]MDW8120342.1 aldo/keto reductase [Chloroflexota bacterium]
MRTRPLGTTGLLVSEVGFGAWAIGGNLYGNSYGPTDDAVSRRALQEALDLGCTFFDTADVYGHGHSEELVGEVVGNRPDVVVATKVGGNFYRPHGVVMDFSPRYIRFACEQSLRRLRRDVIDLYQLHNPPLPFLFHPGFFAVLEDLQKEGKIRFYGVSIHAPQEGMAALRTGRPAALQAVYNLLRQEMAVDLFPLAHQQGVGIIAREPLHNGFLTGKYTEDATFPPGDIRHLWPRAYIRRLVRAAEALRPLTSPQRSLAHLAIRFVLDNPAISVVIPGAKTPEQVRENMAASALPPLTEEEKTYISRVLQDWEGESPTPPGS